MRLKYSPTCLESESLLFFQLKIIQLKKKKCRNLALTINPVIQNHLKVKLDCLKYETDQLQITLWGGIEIHTVNRLRATLHIQLKSNQYASFRDTADLYSHSQSDRLIKQAAEKLEISSSIVTEAITGLTKELETYRSGKREEKRKASK